MAEALPYENRAVSDLEGGVRLLHSNEQDPFRALQFLIPSRLEGKWGAVDWKAGGLADARHIGLHLSILILDLLVFPGGPSLTYALLFFPLTPCLYPIMVAPLPGYLLPPLGLSPVVPRKGPLVAEPETGSGAGPETIPITLSGGKVLGLPLLAALFPYFPPGPTLLVIEITP